MWIVRVALDRSYTFIVLALLILILSPVVILRTPTDIFPNINIPVVAVAWTYTGLNPEELEGRLTSVSLLLDLRDQTYANQSGFFRDTNSLHLDALADWTRQRLPFRLRCACPD
jgi:hypothetical protein